MVDVESDGLIPGDYSMICFGAVIVEQSLDRTFYGRLKPMSDKFIPDAPVVSGFSRDETLAFEEPQLVMERLSGWVAENCPGRAMFVSGNNGFDCQFINWYFHHSTGANPWVSALPILARSIRE
jgi:hypothetical protein